MNFAVRVGCSPNPPPVKWRRVPDVGSWWYSSVISARDCLAALWSGRAVRCHHAAVLHSTCKLIVLIYLDRSPM